MGLPSRTEAARRGCGAVRPSPRLRRRAGGGSPLQPLGRREAEVHASRRPEGAVLEDPARDRVRARSCSSSRCRSSRWAGIPRSCSTSPPAASTSSARTFYPDRQPPPRGVRVRHHRHRLLRRLDVRADVVRVRLPADGVARVPLPSHRGLPRRRAVEPAEAEPGALDRPEVRHQGGEVVDLDGGRAPDVVDLRRLLHRVGAAAARPRDRPAAPGRAPCS